MAAPEPPLRQPRGAPFRASPAARSRTDRAAAPVCSSGHRIAVFGGRSAATSALVRRSRNGFSRAASNLAAFVILLFLDRRGEDVGKTLGVAEQPRHRKGELRPQLAEMVLHRRAGQAQPLPRLQSADERGSIYAPVKGADGRLWTDRGSTPGAGLDDLISESRVMIEA